MPGGSGGHIGTVALPGELRVVGDVAEAFADLVVEVAPASLALSGGDTARRSYEELAGRALEWSGAEVFFGDERFVPAGHPDSNEGMARRALLDRVRPKVVHPMYRPGPVGAAADAYDELVRAAPPIELVHLGLGPDGHTASLFPRSPALDERERLVVATGDDAHPHPRLTLTLPGIARSPLVVFTVEGETKRDALDRLGAGADLPAARVRADTVVWLVDAAAAGHA